MTADIREAMFNPQLGCAYAPGYLESKGINPSNLPYGLQADYDSDGHFIAIYRDSSVTPSTVTIGSTSEGGSVNLRYDADGNLVSYVEYDSDENIWRTVQLDSDWVITTTYNRLGEHLWDSLVATYDASGGMVSSIYNYNVVSLWSDGANYTNIPIGDFDFATATVNWSGGGALFMDASGQGFQLDTSDPALLAQLNLVSPWGEVSPGFRVNGDGSTALTMVFKLVMAAQQSWRRLNGPKALPKLIEGVTPSAGGRSRHRSRTIRRLLNAPSPTFAHSSRAGAA